MPTGERKAMIKHADTILSNEKVVRSISVLDKASRVKKESPDITMTTKAK